MVTAASARTAWRAAHILARWLKIVVWLTALATWGSKVAAAQAAASPPDTDIVDDAGGGDVVIPASGLGIGYSVGAGITLPVASMVSLAYFGNWNVGQYDLTSVSGVLERDGKHEYLELGVGVTVR